MSRLWTQYTKDATSFNRIGLCHDIENTIIWVYEDSIINKQAILYYKAAVNVVPAVIAPASDVITRASSRLALTRSRIFPPALSCFTLPLP